MRSPSEMEQDLKELIAAWERLSPGDTYAGLTLADFKAAVQESFTTRAHLAELRLDFHQWLLRRALADEVSSGKYQQVILGIRCHPTQGNNSPMLRATGYIIELERASGLSRGEGPAEALPTPIGPTAVPATVLAA